MLTTIDGRRREFPQTVGISRSWAVARRVAIKLADVRRLHAHFVDAMRSAIHWPPPVQAA
jgi:hypothetical protein